MTDDAIKMAAERANSLVGDYCLPVDGKPGCFHTRQDDEWRIRQAWLAANDQTPVDARWLESVLGLELTNEDEDGWWEDSGRLFAILDGGDEWQLTGKTRAEVLGLITWLRVPLVERTEQPR